MRRFAFFLMALLFAVSSAKGQEILGSDEPVFIAAKEAWLADDQRSVCIFLQLVDRGNPAAAWFLLGLHHAERTCDDPAVTTPILVSKWLQETATLEPALERLFKANLEGVERVEYLLNLGGPRLAFEHLFEVERIDDIQQDDPPKSVKTFEALSPAKAEWLDPALKLFHLLYSYRAPYADSVGVETWLHWFETACRDNKLHQEPFQPLALLCDGSHSITFKNFFDAYADSRMIERSAAVVLRLNAWLGSDWRTAPYRTVCEQVCPNNPDGCLYPIFLINSSMYGLFSLHSPSETIVPQPIFAASERAAGNVWRGLRHQFGYFPDWVRKSLNHSKAAECLIEAIGDDGLRWERSSLVK